MVIVGLPYSFKGQLRMDEITGGSPYGASTLAEDGHGGDRRPSVNELSAARFQGQHVAEVTLAMALGRRQRARVRATARRARQSTRPPLD